MSDFASRPDRAMTPDSIEFDPFEMDWPWPGMRSEPAAEERAADGEPSASRPAPQPVPRLP